MHKKAELQEDVWCGFQKHFPTIWRGCHHFSGKSEAESFRTLGQVLLAPGGLCRVRFHSAQWQTWQSLLPSLASYGDFVLVQPPSPALGGSWLRLGPRGRGPRPLATLPAHGLVTDVGRQNLPCLLQRLVCSPRLKYQVHDNVWTWAADPS